MNFEKITIEQVITNLVNNGNAYLLLDDNLILINTIVIMQEQKQIEITYFDSYTVEVDLDFAEFYQKVIDK